MVNDEAGRRELEPDVVEVTLPPPVADRDEDGPRPRRISIRKIDKMIRRKETRWFQRHIAPLYELVEVRAVGTEALMAYARLWQLERWLKDLLQLELQAAYGPSWSKQLGDASSRQANASAPNAYMASVDDRNPLAYADLGELRDILVRKWSLASYAFPPKARWTGILETLITIRNRVGHCRQSNPRDVGRLEDALRDLTPGARKMSASYADHEFIDESFGVLYEHWHRDSPNQHHLADHATRNYNTTLHLRTSKRPWADIVQDVRSGQLVHVQYRSHRDAINFAQLAEDLGQVENIGELIHLDILGPRTVEAVFSRGEAVVLDDLIHALLDLVLRAESRATKGALKTCRNACGVDYRVRFNDYFADAADMWRADVFRVELAKA